MLSDVRLFNTKNIFSEGQKKNSELREWRKFI